MSDLPFLLRADTAPLTCDVMPLVPQAVQKIRRKNIIRIHHGGEELVVHATVLDRCAYVHSPVEVQ